jgi:uncharacterized protein
MPANGSLSRNGRAGNNAPLCRRVRLGYTGDRFICKGMPSMIRLLILIGLIAIAVWLWRRLQGNPRQTVQPPVDTEKMVRCSHCSLHVPETSAFSKDGLWYCSQAHLQQGPVQRDQ